MGAKVFLLQGIEKDPLFLFLAPLLGRVAALQWGAFFHPFPRTKKGLGEEFVGRIPSFIFLLARRCRNYGFYAGRVETLLKIILVFAIIYPLGNRLSGIFGG